MTLYDGIDKKYLDIRIIGENPRERQELLTIIRVHVKQINDRFSKIEITEQVPCRCEPSCSRFFAYQDLLNAEAAGRSEIDCQRSWKKVSVSRLLDGVERMKQDNEKGNEKQWASKYGGIHADNVFISDVTGDYNEVHTKPKMSDPTGPDAATEEPHSATDNATGNEKGKDKGNNKENEKGEQKDTSEKAANWMDALLKLVIILFLLSLAAATLYLLATGQLKLPDVVTPFFGNLPGP